MTSKPTRRSAIEKNDRRRIEIVEIAIPIFAAQGPDGVSLRDIAKAAGMKVGTLYYYFPEKQELYEAAVDHALACSSRAIRKGMFLDASAHQRLESVIDAHLTVFSVGNPIGALADRELLRVASDRKARRLTHETIGNFRASQDAFRGVIAAFARLPKEAPELVWLEEFATSAIYGVARLYPWYEQTRSSGPPSKAKRERLKAELRDTLIAAFRGFARTEKAPQRIPATRGGRAPKARPKPRPKPR